MPIRSLNTGSSSTAIVDHATGTMQFLLDTTLKPSESLWRSSLELREQSARLLRQAHLAEDASAFFAGEGR